MRLLKIRGGRPLEGTVEINGAKNSVLPILAATLINGGVNVLHNCPDLRDVASAIQILEHLGCKVSREGKTVIVDSSVVDRCDVPDRLMREMRSSVIFLGPIIARCGEALLHTPGGCELGPRPIDLHLDALTRLGVSIRREGGAIRCKAGDMRGRDILLAFPSVGATENIMLAATACRGVTRIINAAREPEIEDLQQFLRKTGAACRGAGESEITVTGGPTAFDTEHRIMPDRIEAATYLCAAAAAGGDLTLRNCQPAHFGTVIEKLSDGGAEITARGRTVRIRARERLRAMPLVRTMPYPGFPTDGQSQLMAAACTSAGTTVFQESIFENRYRHVGELERMGARIRVSGRIAVVDGVERLHGAQMQATDLRGGAAMVIAALAAEGESTIGAIEHIDRGYEHIERVLSGVGGQIERVRREVPAKNDT
ncbi:MAG: UDP-N-acetylglucosamine 1-carboxyvinyltransferase [Butyricicoccaceae bacterium]